MTMTTCNVLEPEDGCIYVGKTTNPSARLGQHRNGGGYKGSAWPPTNCQ